MEKIDKKRTNHTLVIIVTFFTGLLIWKILTSHWEGWMIPVSLAGIVSLWVIHLRNTFSLKMESYLICAVAIFYMFFYGNHPETFEFHYPMVLAFYIMANASLDDFYIIVAEVASYYVAFIYQFAISNDPNFLSGKHLPTILMLSVLYSAYNNIGKHSEEIRETEQAFARIERERNDREDFLANVSHELRTPVNAITGMADSMLNSDLSGERRKEALAINNAGRRLLRQIEDILDYSELLSDRMINEKSVYSFETLLADIKEAAEHANSEKGLSISYETDPDIPSLLIGDTRKIRHCMRNIIENAVKYTHEGNVAIRIFSRRENYGVNLTFVVEDTGVGMDVETIEKTYGRYFNTGDEGVLHSDGLKLGLIVSRGLVSAMDGFLNMESVPGKGTLVSVTVPQGVENYDSWERESLSLNESVPDLTGKKVLIVDDESMNLSVAERILSAYNPKVETADGGNMATRMCRQNVYDLIFMDHMMPDLDGIEALKIIRGDASSLNKDTPVIALTANVVSGAREMFLSEGFNEFVAKPIERALLERALNRVSPLMPVKEADRKPDVTPEQKPDATPEQKTDTIPEQQSDAISEEVVDTIPEATVDTTAEVETDTIKDSENDPVASLSKMGVNTEAALAYCAESKEFYLMMLTDFLNSIPGRLSELEEYLKTEDFDNYRIKVHALKSNTRTLGFDEMSDAALASEEALKAGDSDAAIGMHPGVTEKLMNIEAILKEVL